MNVNVDREIPAGSRYVSTRSRSVDRFSGSEITTCVCCWHRGWINADGVLLGCVTLQIVGSRTKVYVSFQKRHQAPVPLTIFRSNSKFDKKIAVLWFTTYSTNHNESLHTPRQCNCRDVQDFVVINWTYFKPEHSKCSWNFEFDRSTVSETGTRSMWQSITHSNFYSEGTRQIQSAVML